MQTKRRHSYFTAPVQLLPRPTDRLRWTEPPVYSRCIHDKQLFERLQVAASDFASVGVLNEVAKIVLALAQIVLDDNEKPLIIKAELSAKALILKAGQKEVNDELGSLGDYGRHTTNLVA